MLQEGLRERTDRPFSEYSRLQKVEMWAWDDLVWFSFFSSFGVGGYHHHSCSPGNIYRVNARVTNEECHRRHFET